MRAQSFGLIVVLLLIGSACGREWSPGEFPNPSNSEGAIACGRGGVLGSVCDPEHYISSDSADVVEGHLKQINDAEYPYGSSGCREKDASFSPGFQVGVAILSAVRKEQGESPEDAVRRFSEHVFDAWGIGQKDCGNGLLLLLALEDRQVYIAVGSRVDEFASKENLQVVINNMKPHLRAKDYQFAIEQAVIDLGLVLAGADPSHHEESNEDSQGGFYALIGGIIAIGGFAYWRKLKHRDQQKDAESLLQKLQREQESAQLTGKYPAASCPVCFEDLQPLKVAASSAPPAENTEPSAPPFESSSEDQKPGNLSEKDIKQPLLTRRKSREKVAQDVQQQPSTSGQAGAEEQDSRKKPLCLPCGHTFCVECISEWLKKNTQCPICRAHVGSAESLESRQSALAAQSPGTLAYDDDHLYRTEMAYRMGRLQRMYPQLVPQSAIHSRGDWIDFNSMRQQMMHSETRTTYHDSGHTGSSFSFGGGHHSHSAGGVGGSW